MVKKNLERVQGKVRARWFRGVGLNERDDQELQLKLFQLAIIFHGWAIDNTLNGVFLRA